jgi:hypothetical protein
MQERGVCWVDPNFDPNQPRFRHVSPTLAERENRYLAAHSGAQRNPAKLPFISASFPQAVWPQVGHSHLRRHDLVTSKISVADPTRPFLILRPHPLCSRWSDRRDPNSRSSTRRRAAAVPLPYPRSAEVG